MPELTALYCMYNNFIFLTVLNSLKKIYHFIVVIILFFIIIIILMTISLSFVKHFELPPFMKCASF